MLDFDRLFSIFFHLSDYLPARQVIDGAILQVGVHQDLKVLWAEYMRIRLRIVCINSVSHNRGKPLDLISIVFAYPSRLELVGDFCIVMILDLRISFKIKKAPFWFGAARWFYMMRF